MSSFPPLRAVRRRLPLLGGALALTQLPALVLLAPSGWPEATRFFAYLVASLVAATGLFAIALALWRRIARIVELVQGYAEHGRLPDSLVSGTKGSLETVRTSLTSLDRVVRDLEHEAARDPLTGVSNRRAGAARLREDLARAHRAGAPFSLALFDLDRLKAINDRWGHTAGDEAVRRLAHTLQDAVREGDWIARWGGDEFLLGLWGTSGEAAEAMVVRVLGRLSENALEFDAVRVALGSSVGLTSLKPEDDVDGLFARADEALLDAKRRGRNQFCRT